MLSKKPRFLPLVTTALLIPLSVAAAPFDRGWIKERVLDKISDVLGRRIEVMGDIDIDLSWTPSLRAEQVRIENAEWSDTPYMAELGVLEASIDLRRLIKGQLVIPELTILQPQLLLEVSADNQANWDFAAGASDALPQAQDIAETALDTAIRELERSGEPPPQDTAEADPENPPDLPLIKKIHVETGRFRYLNHQTGVDLQATLDSVDGQMDAEKTAIEIGATIEERPVSLTINGGSFYALNRADRQYPLAIDIEAEDFRIGLQGDLRNPLNLGGGELALTIEGAGMPALVNAWTGSELPPLPDYRLTAGMTHDGNTRWLLQDLDARFGASDLSGELVLDTAEALPRISARLHSETFDAAELNAIAAGLDLGEEAPDNQPVVINVTPLQQLNAEFSLDIVRLIAPGAVALDDITMQARLEDGQLDLKPLQLTIGGGSVNGELSVAAADVLTGSARLLLNDVDLGQAMATLDQKANGDELGIVNGSTRIRLVETKTGNGEVTLETLLDHLRLDDSELRYQDADEGTDLQLNLAVTGEQHELSIKAGGELQNQQVMLDIRGGPIGNLDKPATPYEISGEAALGGLQGNIAGFISNQDDVWQLQDFEIGFGTSRLSGEAALDLSGERPKLSGDFASPLLDLAELSELTAPLNGQNDAPAAAQDDKTDPDQQDESQQETDAALTGMEALRGFDADLSLKLDEMRLPGALQVNNAAIELTLENGKLTIDPLRAELGGSAFSLTGSLDAAAETPGGTFTLDLGEIELAAMADAFGMEQPLPGRLAGTLTFTLTGEPAQTASDLAVPGFGRIGIEPSELKYTAPELEIDITATLSTRTLDSGRQRLVVDAGGRYRGETFKLSVSGGSPLLFTDSAKPAYPISAELTVAETTLKVSGELAQPINPNRLDLDIAVAGPDPAVLEPLLGFAPPTLPPYQLEGRLSRKDDIIEINNFSGRVGDSDLGGDIRIEPETDPLTLYATMYSNHLDLDDLGGLIGRTPDAGAGETASAEQRQEDNREEQSPYLLPHKPLDLQKLSAALQGVIKFTGKRVEAPKLPIDDIEVTIKIDNGVLALEPLTFGVGDGTIKSNLRFDTGKQPVEGTVESEIQRVNLKKLLAPFEISDDSLGVIGGRIKLWVSGNSIGDFFASADGGLFLLMTDGRLDVLLTELAGLDLGEALVALAGDVQSVPIDCAYIDAHTENGILQLKTAVIDTSDTVFLADGFIDFTQELIGMVIQPQPKDISLLSFRSPLHIEGRLKEPSVYPGPSELLVRGAAAVLLGLATPVAALIPLIEPGTGEDTVYCKGLVDAIDQAR